MVIEVKGGERVEVRAHREKPSLDTGIDYEIWLPPATEILILSLEASVNLSGTRADVEVRTNHGEIILADIEGSVQANTSTASIDLSDIRGALILDTAAGNLSGTRIQGDIFARSVAGNLRFESIDGNLDLLSQNGTLFFKGVIQTKGIYKLAGFKGGVEVVLDPMVDAKISVGTMKGSFTSDFPMGEVTPLLGSRFELELGDGDAKIEITTDQGDITLRAEPTQTNEKH